MAIKSAEVKEKDDHTLVAQCLVGIFGGKYRLCRDRGAIRRLLRRPAGNQGRCVKILEVKARYPLRLAVLQQREVVLLQAGDRFALFVTGNHVYQHQFALHSHPVESLVALGGPRLLRRRLRHCAGKQKRGNQRRGNHPLHA
jgi:hypothetical protein